MPARRKHDRRHALDESAHAAGECEHALSPLTLATDPYYDFVDVAQGVSGDEFSTPRDQVVGGGERLNLYRQSMSAARMRRPLMIRTPHLDLMPQQGVRPTLESALVVI